MISLLDILTVRGFLKFMSGPTLYGDGGSSSSGGGGGGGSSSNNAKSRAAARSFISKDVASGKITSAEGKSAMSRVGDSGSGTSGRKKAAYKRKLKKERKLFEAAEAKRKAKADAKAKSDAQVKAKADAQAKAKADAKVKTKQVADADRARNKAAQDALLKGSASGAEKQRQEDAAFEKEFRAASKTNDAQDKSITNQYNADTDKARNDAAQASLLSTSTKDSDKLGQSPKGTYGSKNTAETSNEQRRTRGKLDAKAALGRGELTQEQYNNVVKAIDGGAQKERESNEISLSDAAKATGKGVVKGAVGGAGDVIDLLTTGTFDTELGDKGRALVDGAIGDIEYDNAQHGANIEGIGEFAGSLAGGGGVGGAITKGVTKVGGAIKGGAKAGKAQRNLIKTVKKDVKTITPKTDAEAAFLKALGKSTDNTVRNTAISIREGGKKGFATGAGATGGAASAEGKGTGTGSKGAGTGGKVTGTGGKVSTKTNLNKTRNSLADDLAVSKGYKSVTPTKLRSSTKVDGKPRSSKVNNKFKKDTKADTKVITKPRSSFKPSKGTGGSSSLLKTGGRATGAAAGGAGTAGGEGGSYTGGGSGTGVTTKPGITTPGKATPGTAAGEGAPEPQGRKESPTERADKLSEQRRRAITPGGAKSRLGGTGKEASAGDSSKLGGRNEKAKGRPFKKKDSKEYASLLNISPKKKKELETGIGFYNINVRPGGRGGPIGL